MLTKIIKVKVLSDLCVYLNDQLVFVLKRLSLFLFCYEKFKQYAYLFHSFTKRKEALNGSVPQFGVDIYLKKYCIMHTASS